MKLLAAFSKPSDKRQRDTEEQQEARRRNGLDSRHWILVSCRRV